MHYVMHEMPVLGSGQAASSSDVCVAGDLQSEGEEGDEEPEEEEKEEEEQTEELADTTKEKEKKAKQQLKTPKMTAFQKAKARADARRAMPSDFGRCCKPLCGCALKPTFVLKQDKWMKFCPARRKRVLLKHGIFDMSREEIARIRPFDKRRAAREKRLYNARDVLRPNGRH